MGRTRGIVSIEWDGYGIQFAMFSFLLHGKMKWMEKGQGLPMRAHEGKWKVD